MKRVDRTIEIYPGVSARLRGSGETYRAMLHDQYDPVDCAGCEAPLFVIRDAGYVVCPACKAVSLVPLFAEAGRIGREEEPTASQRLEGGVGLGFDFEELRKVLTAFGRQRASASSRARNAVGSEAA
jgi:LSD1 subclass zinc finger protein